ncbi:butyrophilin subfamily 3 member A3-like [Mauremys reevesii]|uniref:butyrophilin subfamily 3 member A3-like n=1 Tax=Mauremys reevesii TaxID=260615 RepID=UPI00193F0D53|nr:butyrophilin subfamily 3 member A3-like [Mauremys reevesii]
MEVRWFRSEFASFVHLYHDGKDQYDGQMPEYQGRTALLKAGLTAGHVPLRILNIRRSDEGRYICFVQDDTFYEETVLELRVAEKRDNEIRWRRSVAPIEEANVTLDPETAHPKLILSKDLKSVRWGDTWQDLPDNPERFNSVPSVLGCAGFSSGRHCWEVEVGEGQFWAVGVARDSVGRKGRISLSPERGIWAVGWGEGGFQALTSPVTPLPLSQVPSRIRVCLDCDRGQVTFIDAGDEAPIFTFPPGSVPGERIRPWFCVGPESRLRLSLRHVGERGEYSTGALKSTSLASHTSVSMISEDSLAPGRRNSSVV